MSEAQGGGHKVLGVRWVDVKQVDGTHSPSPVAKDIIMYHKPELFAATPPTESLEYLIPRAAFDRAMSIMRVAVRTAYLYAGGRRRIQAKLPCED